MRLNLDYFDIERFENCMNSYAKRDEEIRVLEELYVETEPRQFPTDIDESLQIIAVESAGEIPISQRQYKIILPVFWKPSPEDVTIGSIYIEKGLAERDYPYAKIQIIRNDSSKLEKNEEEIKNRVTELVIKDIEGYPLQVSRADYVARWIRGPKIISSEGAIPTRVIVPNYIPPKQEPMDKSEPMDDRGLDDMAMAVGDKKNKYNPAQDPLNPCYDEGLGLAKAAWWLRNKIKKEK